jgi:hypothetical protein
LRRLSKHRSKAKVYSDRARRCFGAIQQSRPRETRQSLVDMGVAALPLKRPCVATTLRCRSRRGAAVPLRPCRARYVPCVRRRTGIFAPASAVSLCADLETVSVPMPSGRRRTSAETPLPRVAGPRAETPRCSSRDQSGADRLIRRGHDRWPRGHRSRRRLPHRRISTAAIPLLLVVQLGRRLLGRHRDVRIANESGRAYRTRTARECGKSPERERLQLVIAVLGGPIEDCVLFDRWLGGGEGVTAMGEAGGSCQGPL